MLTHCQVLTIAHLVVKSEQSNKWIFGEKKNKYATSCRGFRRRQTGLVRNDDRVLDQKKKKTMQAPKTKQIQREPPVLLWIRPSYTSSFSIEKRRQTHTRIPEIQDSCTQMKAKIAAHPTCLPSTLSFVYSCNSCGTCPHAHTHTHTFCALLPR